MVWDTPYNTSKPTIFTQNTHKFNTNNTKTESLSYKNRNSCETGINTARQSRPAFRSFHVNLDSKSKFLHGTKRFKRHRLG